MKAYEIDDYRPDPASIHHQNTTEFTLPPTQKRKRQSTLSSYFQRTDTSIARALERISPKPQNPYQARAYREGKLKRGVDLFIGIPIAIAATPVILAAATAVKLENLHMPVFFHHLRDGRNCVKIRTMPVGNDYTDRSVAHFAGRHESANPDISPLGHFLRKTKIDELPQLYGVVRGDLTLVGSRPAHPAIHDLVKNEWSAERYSLWQAYRQPKPGLTGTYQLSEKSTCKDDPKRMHFDVFDARNSYLGHDLYIIWRTVEKVLSSFFST